MYTIEDNVPVTGATRPSRKLKYPLDKLAVGQSFFVPDKGKNMTQLRSLAYAWAKRHKVTFVLRTTTEGDSVGTRIWRTA